MSVIMPGVCRHCSCTDGTPCSYCKGVHDQCQLVGPQRLVCSNPACLAAEKARIERGMIANAEAARAMRLLREKRRHGARRRKGRAA